MSKLKLFMVNKAEYFINDDEGKRVSLVVDYYHNRYYLKTHGRKVGEYLKSKAGKIAGILLHNKHRVNFSYKYPDK